MRIRESEDSDGQVNLLLFFRVSHCKQICFLHLEDSLPPLQLGHWAETQSPTITYAQQGFDSEACVAEKYMPPGVHSGENGSR